MKSLEQYREEIKGATCRWHQEPVPLDGPIRCYDHSGGWTVEGMSGKHWLFVTCPECGYDWSLSKLGVAREPE